MDHWLKIRSSKKNENTKQDLLHYKVIEGVTSTLSIKDKLQKIINHHPFHI